MCVSDETNEAARVVAQQSFLSLRANITVPVEEWTAAMRLVELPERTGTRANAGEADLLLYRAGDRIIAVSNRCTHQGAPLHRDVVRESGSLLTVTCPLHGSTFQLPDGRVMRGPAMAGLPVYEARVIGDMLEVRSAP